MPHYNVFTFRFHLNLSLKFSLCCRLTKSVLVMTVASLPQVGTWRRLLLMYRHVEITMCFHRTVGWLQERVMGKLSGTLPPDLVSDNFNCYWGRSNQIHIIWFLLCWKKKSIGPLGQSLNQNCSFCVWPCFDKLDKPVCIKRTMSQGFGRWLAKLY